jgi:hypothetical protein
VLASTCLVFWARISHRSETDLAVLEGAVHLTGNAMTGIRGRSGRIGVDHDDDVVVWRGGSYTAEHSKDESSK